MPGSILAHGVHLEADEVRRVADAGCWLVQNPRSNRGNRVGYPSALRHSEKVALGTVEYHYPIHQFVAGSLYADVGRVAPSYAELFQRDGWKTGVGAGFIFLSRDKVLFTFDVAYGDGVMFHFTTDPLRAFSNRDTEL